MRTNGKGKDGFTLVELLVVVAVIAVLASLLVVAVNSAKGKARRITCANNLRQINLGLRMYSDDWNDKAPKYLVGANGPFFTYKMLMNNYVGSSGGPAVRAKLFACPADTFYYDYALGLPPFKGYVPESYCSQSVSDYSSYALNSGNLYRDTNKTLPGIAGWSISSIKHPSRTVLVAEVPAFIPFSWHQPKQPVQSNGAFEDAMDVIGFVDGHVSYIKVFWDTKAAPYTYNPPAGYEYQWSGE